MPNISGNVSYATSRFNGISGLVGTPSIPVIVQDTISNVGIVVLTDASGNFTVNSIPAGNYRIVEAYGTTGGIPSPVNYILASTIPKAVPKDPPLSAFTSTISGTNQVDSLSPNTRYATLTTANLTGQNFVDSSVGNIPLSLPTGISIGNNILTNAGNGIWGTLPDGTTVNTIPPTYPYTNSMVSSLLTYQSNLSITSANAFTMSNINTTIWFYAPNHTTFDETSSYLLINGGDPNALIFQQTVSVNPNSYYLASAWLIMITNAPGTTTIGFKVLGQDGVTQLYYSQTSNIQYPKWGEIGKIFNTKNNSSVTVQVLSQSSVAVGNDFALDDVSLKAVDLNTSSSLTKSVDKSSAAVGDVLTYTSVINTNVTMNNVIFKDTIPLGTTFASGTVKINGATVPSYNPQTGFFVPTIPQNGVTTITFNVNVVSIPQGNTINNVSNVSYYTSIIAPDTIDASIVSNTVPTVVQQSDLTGLTKAVDKTYATTGETITYTITIPNVGNITADNVIFFDTIPTGTTFNNNSLVINGVSDSSNPQSSVNIGSIAPGGLSTVSFSVTVNSDITTPNPIPNNSYVVYSTPSQGTVTKGSNTVNTQINYVNLGNPVKSVDKNYANVGDTIRYTIAFFNSGNVTASNILFIDTIPNDTTLVANSFKQDTTNIPSSPNPPGVTLPNSIGPQSVSTIVFDVTINTIPNPNPIPNNATASYTYTVDPSAPNGKSENVNTNTVNTQVNNANLGSISKSADKAFATCGDTITYTISIPNTGNITANNVILSDTVPNGTVFVADSILVNGESSGATSPTNVPLGTINPGATTTVSFKVQVVC